MSCHELKGGMTAFMQGVQQKKARRLTAYFNLIPYKTINYPPPPPPSNLAVVFFFHFPLINRTVPKGQIWGSIRKYFFAFRVFIMTAFTEV
jgi:hypothetical protein